DFFPLISVRECRSGRLTMKNESKIAPKSADSGGAKKSLVNVDDHGWKIASRNRAAQLTVMKRTTFPDKLNLEPADSQKSFDLFRAISFVLVMGILTVVGFVFLVGYFSFDMYSSISRRASYLLVYKAVHTSKMTEDDKKEYDEIWNVGVCHGMHVTKWTDWRLALMPRKPDGDCAVCHKVVKMRTRTLIAREPPDNGRGCPATIEWAELVRKIKDHLR
ncbi:hypothetical protein PRIPAC_92884, partial [Pristionchus pacificus]|uniref:Uncharacterized protein n=1 Tax=Pristionchus pacificus TaxID=54126 RepID=A0A2A6BQK9_PRIPA